MVRRYRSVRCLPVRSGGVQCGPIRSANRDPESLTAARGRPHAILAAGPCGFRYTPLANGLRTAQAVGRARRDGGLSSMVEQRFVEPPVAGSSPAGHPNTLLDRTTVHDPTRAKADERGCLEAPPKVLSRASARHGAVSCSRARRARRSAIPPRRPRSADRGHQARKRYWSCRSSNGSSAHNRKPGSPRSTQRDRPRRSRRSRRGRGPRFDLGRSCWATSGYASRTRS